MSLVIVGSVAFDTIETPFDKRERVIGGACTYAAIAASSYTKPHIVGVVGEDFTDGHMSLLKEKGIDTRGIKREKGRSFFWSGKYRLDMNTRETLATELNVFEKFDPVLPDDYRDLPYLFLANIDPPLQLKVLNSMNKPEFVVCDTMNLWIDIKKEELIKVFEKTDCVVLNDEEIRQFTGKTGLIQGAKEIQKIGPGYVIIKKGEHGASVVGPESFYFSVPSYPVENVIDPTGAGDSFAGAFIGYLAGKKAAPGNREKFNAEIKKAMVHGNTVASFTVEGFSIERLMQASPQKIEARIEEIRRIVSF